MSLPTALQELYEKTRAFLVYSFSCDKHKAEWQRTGKLTYGQRCCYAPYPDQLEEACQWMAFKHYHRIGELAGEEMLLGKSRQAGKDELIAQLNVLHLVFGAASQIHLTEVLTAPTFDPQVLNSITRTKDRLAMCPMTKHRNWEKMQAGNVMRNGNASLKFQGGKKEAKGEGATANDGLKVDEIQDFDPNVYYKRYRPMLLSLNAPTLLKGTAWNNLCLFHQKRVELEARQEEADIKALGLRLVHLVTADVRGRHNPAYLKAVEKDIKRLGRQHPIVKTQFFLETVDTLGKFLDALALREMRGEHPRRKRPSNEEVWRFAGIDCNSHTQFDQAALMKDPSLAGKRDLMVIFILEGWFDQAGLPNVRCVEIRTFLGQEPLQHIRRVQRILWDIWNVDHVAGDERGPGSALMNALKAERPDEVTCIGSEGNADESAIGWQFIAYASTGRFEMFADDGSEEYQQFWIQAEACEKTMREGKKISWHAPTRKQPIQVNGVWVTEEIHDDILKAGAYAIVAAQKHLTGAPYDKDVEADPVPDWNEESYWKEPA